MREVIGMPKLGDAVEVVVIIDVLVTAGEVINEGDALVEVETDKIEVEVPSPIKGTIIEILVASGDEVPVGGPICVVDT